LHTNDSAGAAVRLINMGIEPFLITSSLLGVLAQRLVRSVCPCCKENYKINSRMLEELDLEPGDVQISRGKGCPKCLNSGYKGRLGIFELLIPNEEIRQLILKRRSSEEIRAAARKAGMRTLRESGVDKICSGLTTPEELFRVTRQVED
jgi:type II secretory ATPase GspE/PulE/Tfp pilus assembly ATPase PilB-like protein